jgi:hypothetical protein
MTYICTYGGLVLELDPEPGDGAIQYSGKLCNCAKPQRLLHFVTGLQHGSTTVKEVSGMDRKQILEQLLVIGNLSALITRIVTQLKSDLK